MRPSKFGNPFKIGMNGNRRQVIEMYREYVFNNPELLKSIREELKDKTLVCCCYPKMCHGDVILEILETETLMGLY